MAALGSKYKWWHRARYRDMTGKLIRLLAATSEDNEDPFPIVDVPRVIRQLMHSFAPEARYATTLMSRAQVGCFAADRCCCCRSCLTPYPLLLECDTLQRRSCAVTHIPRPI